MLLVKENGKFDQNGNTISRKKSRLTSQTENPVELTGTKSEDANKGKTEA